MERSNITIKVETEGLDEATEKVESLADAIKWFSATGCIKVFKELHNQCVSKSDEVCGSEGGEPPTRI